MVKMSKVKNLLLIDKIYYYIILILIFQSSLNSQYINEEEFEPGWGLM